MSLRHALLALLEAGPLTGYQLAKQFDRSVAFTWHAQHSQIYTELRRLETDGFIRAAETPRGSGTRAVKRPYSITTDGAAELERWVADIEDSGPVRDPWLVKAQYLEFGSYDQARQQMRAHREQYEVLRDRYERHVEDLRARDTALIKRRLDRAEPHAHRAIVAFKLHAYRNLIDRARLEVSWADEGLALVDAMELADAEAAAGEPVHRPRVGD
jgi:PadR family transcriptional regulator AphA